MKNPNRFAPAVLATLIFASGVHAADGVGTLQLRPGHWQVIEQIWLDGKEVLSALGEAARKINEGIRANLSRVIARTHAEQGLEYANSIST